MNAMFTTATRRRDELVSRGNRLDLRPLLGVWVNYDQASPGISRIEIGDWESAPMVRVFGANQPAPVDWGEAVGAAFSDGTGTEAVAFTASYELPFVTVLLAAYLNKRLLVVDAYTVFTDASGRASYFQRDHLYLP
jgi:hypothetical protein